MYIIWLCFEVAQNSVISICMGNVGERVVFVWIFIEQVMWFSQTSFFDIVNGQEV